MKARRQGGDWIFHANSTGASGMFIVHHKRERRAVLHRAECPLLDDRYDHGGWRHAEHSFEGAVSRAQELRPFERRFHVCRWCRPNAPH